MHGSLPFFLLPAYLAANFDALTKAKKYFRYLIPSVLFSPGRTRQILTINPTAPPERKEAENVIISVYDYDENILHEQSINTIEEAKQFKDNGHITWINIDGLRKDVIEKASALFNIHPLIAEDIWSMHQRPKMDEVEGILYCLLNMLYYNEEKHCVEQEQISLVLGQDYLITFQEDPQRDVFNPIRDRLKINNTKLRQRGADYLCYSMLDLIVDNYYVVMEKLGEHIEQLEEEVIRNSNTVVLAKINQLRKELIVLKRNIAPVRDLISGIIRSESDLLDERTNKYFKDVYDHIVQAYELSENYRDVMLSMHDLYINNVNLRMNEVMKVMAIVTCLLAPATVIGGIFGMNFEQIPLLHNKWGFFISVAAMLLIPLWMLRVFRRRGWF